MLDSVNNKTHEALLRFKSRLLQKREKAFICGKGFNIGAV